MIRDRSSDVEALEEVVETLARRAARRLRPFHLVARALTVEVRRATGVERRDESFVQGVAGEDDVARLAIGLATPLLDAAEGVRGIQVRLGRLEAPTAQTPLFPALRPAR